MDSEKISNRERIIRYGIIVLSIIGLMICTAVLFPQVRHKIMDFAEQILNKGILSKNSWINTFFSYAMGGIFFILLFDYLTLVKSGRVLAGDVKKEMKECLSEINFRSFLIPVLILLGIYLLGILTIIRANFLYLDDTLRSVEGSRRWFGWSRYVSELSSIFVHGDPKLTEISPLPQLLAIFILSVSSVLLVYIIGNRKITIVRLLASIPLGLSPYFLECLAYKFDAPYMALSILASIIPFLFIARKKAFFFISAVSLLIMCMTYQTSSGVYPMIAVILCFQNWNSHKKSNKEILSWLGMAALAFCCVLLIFRLFLMNYVDPSESYTSTSIHPVSQMLSGILINMKDYASVIYHDFGLIWKIGIALVCIFFIIKSVKLSSRGKALSFFISISAIVISFILSYGIYILLSDPSIYPRTLFGFGIFLAILCIYVVSDYRKSAIVTVLALNWCFLIFAFSYGNALADQARYAEFRITMLLQDLSNLYPSRDGEMMSTQLKNTVGFAPSVKNISKHYPVIERLVPKRLGEEMNFDNYYYLIHFNVNKMRENIPLVTSIDFNTMDLPVVFDSYYHTIKSDGSHILIILKH